MTDTKPIFADVFADQWEKLPQAMKQHYANRPFSNDRVTVKGTLSIRMGPMMRFFAPVMSWLGMFTPVEGDNIPCTVHFLSEPDSKAFIFERWFDFPGRKPYLFRSKLVPQRNHEVIEYMACGIGWRCTYDYDTDKVILRHSGYVLRLFGRDIPLPGIGERLMGHGGAHEEATSETGFKMHMALQGGIFGALMAYEYAGEFRVTEVALKDA